MPAWFIRGTRNPIFILRQLGEKYRKTERASYDIYRPRESVRQDTKTGAVEMFEREKGAKTRVRSGAGMTDTFGVGVGLHQGSALNPFLFNIVFDVLTMNVREGTPWDMMYADDVVLVGESKEGVELRLEEWRSALESRGMIISKTKTKYMMCTEQEHDGFESVRLDDMMLDRVDAFKYLGSILSADGNENNEITGRIQAG